MDADTYKIKIKNGSLLMRWLHQLELLVRQHVCNHDYVADTQLVQVTCTKCHIHHWYRYAHNHNEADALTKWWSVA